MRLSAVWQNSELDQQQGPPPCERLMPPQTSCVQQAGPPSLRGKTYKPLEPLLPTAVQNQARDALGGNNPLLAHCTSITARASCCPTLHPSARLSYGRNPGPTQQHGSRPSPQSRPSQSRLIISTPRSVAGCASPWRSLITAVVEMEAPGAGPLWIPMEIIEPHVPVLATWLEGHPSSNKHGFGSAGKRWEGKAAWCRSNGLPAPLHRAFERTTGAGWIWWCMEPPAMAQHFAAMSPWSLLCERMVTHTHEQHVRTVRRYCVRGAENGNVTPSSCALDHSASSSWPVNLVGVGRPNAGHSSATCCGFGHRVLPPRYDTPAGLAGSAGGGAC